MFHAEMCSDIKGNFIEKNSDPTSYETFLESRPKDWENKAIDLVIKLCREYGVSCHIVHLSSSDAIEAIERAKKEGLNISVETCYHYLCLSSESIPSGIIFIT